MEVHKREVDVSSIRFARGIVRRSMESCRTLWFWAVMATLLVIRPLLHIRLATFRSERMGHFISDTDLALAMLPSLRTSSGRKWAFIFVMPENVCNEQVRSMYIRTTQSFPGVMLLDCRKSLLARLLLEPTRRLTAVVQWKGKLDKYFCGSTDPAGIDAVGFRPSGRPYLCHSEDDERRARRELQPLGLPDGVPYACIHIRDNAYLESVPHHKTWSYHDYRNPPLDSYIPAIYHLLDSGFAVVRMGKISRGELKIKHPLYFDYSRWERRSDLLDTFIYSRAHVAIAGSASGTDQLALAFGVPFLCTNFVPFEDPRWAVDVSVTLPCLLRDSDSGALLPLSRMLGSRFFSSTLYSEAGLEVVYNTSDQILDALVEILTRINGQWEPTTQDAVLQRQFWEWADRQGIHGRLALRAGGSNHYRSPLGSSFLREYADLLLK